MNGKVAIITGGSRGIGKAIATAFVKEGAQLMLAARKEDQLKKTASALQQKYSVCDVTDLNQVKQVIERTLTAYGKIDCVITAAGIQKPLGKFDTTRMDAWKKCIDVNLIGTANVIHEALPHMKQGSIICLAGAGVPKPFPNFSAYSCSKVGVVQLVANLAKEYPYLRINAIAPGPVATLFNKEVLEAGPAIVGKEFYEKNKEWEKGRGGVVQPEQVAAFIVRLAKREIDVTGKYLSSVWDENFNVEEHTYTLQRIDKRNFDKA